MKQPDDDVRTLDQFHYHASVIDDAVRRWRAGDIDTVTKRSIIADENTRYYGNDRKSPVTGEWITKMPPRYELPAVLADAAGVPLETMERALEARRAASVLYRQLVDDGADRALALDADRDGVDRYREIIASAREHVPGASGQAIADAFAAIGAEPPDRDAL